MDGDTYIHVTWDHLKWYLYSVWLYVLCHSQILKGLSDRREIGNIFLWDTFRIVGRSYTEMMSAPIYTDVSIEHTKQIMEQLDSKCLYIQFCVAGSG